MHRHCYKNWDDCAEANMDMVNYSTDVHEKQPGTHRACAEPYAEA